MSAPDQVAGPVRPHRIPPPAHDRPPLKANIFEKMQSANTQLLPLFPYLGPGAIVPCGALFRGGPPGFASLGGADTEFGRFFHGNDADEVALSWAADTGPFGCGHLRVLANHHGVQGRVQDAASPDSFAVSTITQRQSVSGPQRETMTFRCSKCHEPLVQVEYDALPAALRDPRSPEADLYPVLPTIVGSAQVAETYNASEEQRTCGKCGTVSPVFPLETWGWSTHVLQSRVVNAARRMLDAAGRAALADSQTR
jgi:hypothetical protein